MVEPRFKEKARVKFRGSGYPGTIVSVYVDGNRAYYNVELDSEQPPRPFAGGVIEEHIEPLEEEVDAAGIR